MIKNEIAKKLTLALLGLFLVSLFALFPRTEEYQLEPKESIEYVSNLRVNSIYLIDKDGYLGRATILLKGKTTLNKVREIIEILTIEGTRESVVPSGFRAIIPTGTKVRDSSIKDGIVTLDFSKDLMDVEMNMEEKIIEAIIYSLTELKEIKGITIFMDGTRLESLPKSGKLLNKILDRTYGINKSYQLVHRQNVTDVTIYYLNKCHDTTYYVPVTKYINTTSDKIKIIIHELSSGPIYENNLMSFLNANAKLLKVEQDVDTLTLHFNQYLFNESDSHHVLEEVLYSIALSVYDNYNVNKVTFLVDDTKFVKSVSKTIE